MFDEHGISWDCEQSAIDKWNPLFISILVDNENPWSRICRIPVLNQHGSWDFWRNIMGQIGYSIVGYIIFDWIETHSWRTKLVPNLNCIVLALFCIPSCVVFETHHWLLNIAAWHPQAVGLRRLRMSKHLQMIWLWRFLGPIWAPFVLGQKSQKSGRCGMWHVVSHSCCMRSLPPSWWMGCPIAFC